LRLARLGVALAIAVSALAPAHARQTTPAPGPAPEWRAPEWIAWLERPDRLAGLKVDGVVASLGLKPGDVVADIGAGAGAFEPALAKAVSPGGRVYANEIESAFLDHINRRMAQWGVDNVVTVLGQSADPRLPSQDVDVALFHVVLHHIADRASFLRATAAYLKPSARPIRSSCSPAITTPR
jgi:2-polyprenyl-3-methyl-5-hydroxy-6-metoxy-1,4-benzoquinol methylase